MFFALVMTVKGSAQMLIKRYEPATAMRAQSITTAILNAKPFPSDLAGFEQRRSNWERDAKRREIASGEAFTAGVKKSIYLQKAPNNIGTVVQTQSETSYDELGSTAMQHLQAATFYEDGRQQKWPRPPGPGAEASAGNRTSGASGAMEVDALTRQCPRGRGKDDKGKGRDNEGKSRSKYQKGKGADPMARAAATRQPAWNMAGVFGARLCRARGQRGRCARDCRRRLENPNCDQGKQQVKKGQKGGANEITMCDGWSNVSAPPPGSPSPSTAGPSGSQVGAGVRAITTIDERAPEWEGGFIFVVAKGGKPKGAGEKGRQHDGNGHAAFVLDVDGQLRRDFPNVELESGRNPNVAVANGAPLRHYGSNAATLHIAGDRRIIMEFQVTDVMQPIMSVAWYDGKGELLRHEAAGLVNRKKIKNHYALKRWTNMRDDMEEEVHKEMALLVPIGAAGAAARPGEEDEDGCAVQRTLAGGPRVQPPGERHQPRVASRGAADALADAPTEGPAAFPDDRETAGPETTASGLPGPREPSAEDIERHELSHYPAEPWCEICIQAKADDIAYKKKDRRDELIPLLSSDYGQAGIEGGPVNFEFAVGSGASTGGIWSTAIIQKGRDD
eukprot:9503792-Pyramimonas_sp.AAC.1